MKKETINEIIQLAISSYNSKLKPGDFARKAAHKAALDAAKEHNQDLADFATLNSAAELYVEVASAVNFTSQVTDKAITMIGAFNSYEAMWDRYAQTVIPKYVNENYFQSLAESSNKISNALLETIAPTYETTNVLHVTSRNKAKRAALYVYSDTYSTTRAAYIRAAFLAQNCSGGNPAHIFEKAVEERLKKDLSYDIIHPNIIYALLNTLIFKALLVIILLLSITALLLAVFNLTPIPFVPLISASSGAIAGSIGLMGCSFFATKKCEQIESANANRAENAIFF